MVRRTVWPIASVVAVKPLACHHLAGLLTGYAVQGGWYCGREAVRPVELHDDPSVRHRLPAVHKTVWVAIAAVLLTACSSASPTAADEISYSAGLVLASAQPASSKAVYPPTTLDGVKALAATGSAGAVRLVRTDNVNASIDSCTARDYYVVVAATVTGKALAADLLAFLGTRTPFETSCPVYIYASHTTAETQRSDYTAGKIIDAPSLIEVSTDGTESAPAFVVGY